MEAAGNFSIKAVSKFVNAASDSGWGQQDLISLSNDKKHLKVFLSILRGESTIQSSMHTIDCESTPRIPVKGWKLLKHNRNGIRKWSSDLVEVVTNKGQHGRLFSGEEYYNEIKSLAHANINLMDYLLENQYLIPKSWENGLKGNNRPIFFWGTIFLDVNEKKVVSYMLFDGNHWLQNYLWFDETWASNYSMAILK